MKVRSLAFAIVAFLAGLWSVIAASHEFKMDPLMSAFVKIEGHEAHLAIRVPLFLFKSAKFPVNNLQIDVANATPALERAAAAIASDVTLYEDGRALAPVSKRTRLSLPSDRSFEAYDRAIAYVDGNSGNDIVYVDQGYVDAHLTYAIQSDKSVFAIRTVAARELGDYLKLAVRYLPPGEDGRAMMVTSTSGIVDLNPTWQGAAASFVTLGIAHILTGFDHILFLLCLVIPIRRLRDILAIVTTFTLAHSFTLIGSAFGLAPTGAWFPPFVETAIAVSIIYMALENIMGADLRRRLIVTALFGLVHGFGFSYGLQENMQFAGVHLVVSLLAFNVGIEIGQVAMLAVMLPLLFLVRRYVLRGRVGMIVLSALAAQVAWQWMMARGEALMNTSWPRPTNADLAIAAFWVTGLLLVGGAITLVARRLRLDTPAAIRERRGYAD